MSGTQNAVELKGVVKRFGDFTAVHAMDLAIEEGSFVTFLGPSGCGKTTTLRMIAGLLGTTEGDILVKDRRVNDMPIHKRNLGLVFQNYALFPHKRIFDNIAFGLKYRNVAKAEIAERVGAALDLVQLPQLADRYPHELSGGQQQRIALARAIVIQPDVLLLDEPLSALDANLREDMRVELKRIQDRLGITTIFVTHDQSEALAMSDRIVVMSEGRVEQVGAPEEVYNSPASEFVARFLGNSNLVPARVSARENGVITVDAEDLGAVPVLETRATGVDGAHALHLVIRAEKLRLAPPGEAADPDGARLSGTVDTVDYQGQAARYFVTVNGRQLQAINNIEDHPFAEGAPVSVHIRAKDCVLLPASQ